MAAKKLAALVHLRLFGELLTRHIAANLGEYQGAKVTQREGAMALSKRGVPERVIRMLEDLRRLGRWRGGVWMGRKSRHHSRWRAWAPPRPRAGHELRRRP